MIRDVPSVEVVKQLMQNGVNAKGSYVNLRLYLKGGSMSELTKKACKDIEGRIMKKAFYTNGEIHIVTHEGKIILISSDYNGLFARTMNE